MSLRVTIDIFSGRRNPTVQLDEQTAQAALTLMQPHRLEYADVEKPPVHALGYRGLVVEQLGLRAPHLPRVFRVARGTIFGRGVVARIRDTDLEDLLVPYAPAFSPLALDPSLHGHVRREVDRFRAAPPPSAADAPADALGATELNRLRRGCRGAPLYEPEWWNDGGQKQINNNCYNYSTNYLTGTFAQPGRATRALFTSIAGSSVRNAARADGLYFDPGFDNRCPDEGHLVALVVAPWFDFHWYRKGRDGLWTHKVGIAPATDRDNVGARITDPKTADRGPYTDFVGYMQVRDGHFRIR
jgi:hypothetical protein